MVYNVGIIGAGAVGESHAKIIAKVDGLRLVAAARTDAAALQAFVARYGGDGYVDYRQLLERKDVDCVCIALPHHLHREAVELVAAAGKHILLEKPMAPTAEDCEGIMRAVESAGVKFMLAHTTRFVPAVARAKELIAGGQLGELVTGWAVTAKQWETARRKAWHKERALGGGMWLTNGVHLVDRMLWLFDRPVLSVRGSVGTWAHAQSADDSASAYLTFAGGATAAIHTVGYKNGAPLQGTVIVGTEASLRLDQGAGLFIGRDGGWEAVPGTEGDWMPVAMQGQWEAFRRYLAGECESPVGADAALATMKVMFAAERSSELGRELPIA